MKTERRIISYVLGAFLMAVGISRKIDFQFLDQLEIAIISELRYDVVPMTLFVSGAIIFAAASNTKARVLSGLFLTPFFFVVTIFHVGFDWLDWFGGTQGEWYSFVPPFLIYLSLIFISYKDFVRLMLRNEKQETQNHLSIAYKKMNKDLAS